MTPKEELMGLGVECLPSFHSISQMWSCTAVTPASRKGRQEDEKLKVTLELKACLTHVTPCPERGGLGRVKKKKSEKKK